MHEFNPENATWFTLYTLIDITPSQRRKDVSQKNWDTIINGVSMRCQPLGSREPEKKKKKLSGFKFGNEYKTKVKNVWTWSFAVEYSGIISIDFLVKELNGMPVIDKLEYVETKDRRIKNTYFIESERL